MGSGTDVTAGGAEFNSSGVQGVGGADVADSLAALHQVVFEQKKYSLMAVINALNLKFDKITLDGEKGLRVMTALAKGFFKSGGMEMQLNVLDPDMLEEAGQNPGRYPGIVVRVAGYCAYFDDLPNSVKQEIIDRTRLVPE